MLSTKDLKYQMVRRRMEKLTERFVGPYWIKKIISSNVVELELPSTVKIHPVVNISRIQRYIGQVEEQKKEQPAPVLWEPQTGKGFPHIWTLNPKPQSIQWSKDINRVGTQ